MVSQRLLIIEDAPDIARLLTLDLAGILIPLRSRAAAAVTQA
ncbi:hypothetical protein ACFSC4_22280 [Deinococcus malanensis]|nr:hypothetical protein [Deinococcus malanensis]